MNALHDAANVPHAARLRVEDFLLLQEHGAFDDYSKSELIEGEIICMNSQFSRHARVKSNLAFELETCLRGMKSPLQAIVEVAVAVSADTMPEPDIVLTSFRANGPVPLDTVALVIEVADTTLATDLGRKADIYARVGIPEYWVIDLNEDRCLLHMGTGPDGYAEQIDVPFGEVLISATIDGLKAGTAGLA
ncbi:MAG TPA: Uma2 family endonuclease [Allosphingosinicella sp.]